MRSHLHHPGEIKGMIAAHGLSARIVRDGKFTVWVVVDKPVRPSTWDQQRRSDGCAR